MWQQYYWTMTSRTHFLIFFTSIMGRVCFEPSIPLSFLSAHTSNFWLVNEAAPTWGCNLGPRRSESQDSIKKVCIYSQWDLALASRTWCPCYQVHQPDMTRNVHRELCVSSMAWPFHCVFFKMSVSSVEWPVVSLLVWQSQGFSLVALQPYGFCGTSTVNCKSL